MTVPALPDIASYAAPLYVAFIFVEVGAILRLGFAGEYEAKDTLTSLMMGTGNLLSKLVFGGTIFAAIGAFLLWAYQFRLFTFPVEWWAFVLALVADDLAFYWSHRLRHVIRWGWASHVIHHSSQHYNLSTALRQPWFGFSTGYFVISVPLVLLGFHPAILAFVGSVNLFYQFFIHTESVDRLPGPIEAVFNTPSHHRVHHGKNPQYLDANYGGIFIIWDRMFGTFVAEDAAVPVRYGLVKDLGTFNPLRVATHEYVAIAQDATAQGLNLRQRLAYIFGRPGWSHDGSRLTAQQLKERAQHTKIERPTGR